MKKQKTLTFERTSLGRGLAAGLALSVLMSLTTVVAADAAFGSEAVVENMDSDVHTVVIDKLEMSLKKAKDDETISLAPVRARLADLYSDRARLREMDENKTGEKASGSKSDRARALQLYADVLKESSKEERGPILIHMSHLDLLLAKSADAESIYELIVKEGPSKHAPVILQQAYAGRAEHRYQRGEFKTARADFEVSLRFAAPTKRGPLAHRIAWCNLNLEDQETAVAQLVAILRDPQMLKRESTEGASTDLAFEDEVAMDLATFVARGHVTSEQIALVESLTPDRTKLPVMKHLAEETERLGQPRAALEAWSAVLKHDPRGAERMEVSSRVARLRYNLADKAGSLAAIQTAMKQWSKEGCTEKLDCDNIRKEIRNLISDWTKAETKKPSVNLLGAYTAFVSVFDGDVEMMYFAAETAKAVKQYPTAVALYHKSSQLAHGSKDPRAADILESSLTNEVEMAELAPKEQGYPLRQAAYDFYLSLSPHGKINQKVRYQRARLPYEMGDNAEASQRLEAFAKSAQCKTASSEDHQLCVQAADLDLDARVLMKDDVAVERGALMYSHVFTEKKLEYLKIARTSAMKQANAMEAPAAIAKLASIDTEGMDRDESLRLLKTRMALSEKIHDLPALKSAANQLLKTPKIDAKDHEYALSRLAYASEMQFDFAAAYAMSSKMEMNQLAPADRELKLAMFAELAGKDPTKHEEAFLKLSKNAAKRAVVRAKLVRGSKNPARELARNEGELKHFPSIYAPLVLEIYASTGDRKFAERELRSRALSSQTAGKVLARQLFLADFAKVDQAISTHRIRSRSDSQMQKTLAERIKLLAAVEKQATKAIKSGDWTSQAVTLAVLSRENNRMYSEVMALPVPSRLRGNDRLQYQQLVQNQANLYLQKHDAIQAKLQGFWNDSKAFTAMVDDFATAKPDLRRMMAREMKTLSRVAPGDRQSTLNKALHEGIDQASPTEVANATRAARQAPFSASSLAKLREVEESRSRDTMVAYLDARLSTLNPSKNKEESKQ
jgi:hypothetical protein